MYSFQGIILGALENPSNYKRHFVWGPVDVGRLTWCTYVCSNPPLGHHRPTGTCTWIINSVAKVIAQLVLPCMRPSPASFSEVAGSDVQVHARGQHSWPVWSARPYIEERRKRSRKESLGRSWWMAAQFQKEGAGQNQVTLLFHLRPWEVPKWQPSPVAQQEKQWPKSQGACPYAVTGRENSGSTRGKN